MNGVFSIHTPHDFNFNDNLVFSSNDYRQFSLEFNGKVLYAAFIDLSSNAICSFSPDF